jgi:hypothetical protein
LPNDRGRRPAPKADRRSPVGQRRVDDPGEAASIDGHALTVDHPSPPAPSRWRPRWPTGSPTAGSSGSTMAGTPPTTWPAPAAAGGRGLIPVRWAFVRDATGTHRDEYFVTTDPAMTPVAVVSLYTARWPIETTFQEAREHLGLESLPQRSARSVLRTAACLLGLYTVVALPFADHVRRRPRPVARQASADVRRRPGHGPPAGVTAELIGDPEREVGSRQKATGHAAVRAGPPRPSGVAARKVQKSS